uniref:Zf-BED domain-containing protein n=1 Tax=Tanacetum cinerariifolium TaxID=118510 RepID=A0A699GTM7_TANCI|nr:zf-BED domain-containing protein [Tanacetum cinerariifolium]
MEIKRRLEVDGVNTDVEFDPTNVEFAKWLASTFNNHKPMDQYAKNALWLYWKKGDDEELLTEEEFSDLELENLREGLMLMCSLGIYQDLRRMKNIKIHGSMSYFRDYQWYEGLEDGGFKEETLKEKVILEGLWGHENRKGNNFCSWLKESFGNYRELDYESMLKLEEYWWGKKEEEESSEDAWSNYLPNDEDIDDYLIPKDAPYYVDEEEEGFKERRSKLLGIPYKKSQTFKSKKFEVIKYSFGPAEEYVAIREYEYDIWVRTKENVSHVYQEFFCKKYKGCS